MRTTMSQHASSGEQVIELDERVETVYSALRRIQHGATVVTAIAMGRAIVNGFYGGDLARWRSHGPKDMSLRKLAERFREDGYATSVSTLHRAVAIYELDQIHRVAQHDQLTISHLRLLTGHDKERTTELLEATLKNGWTAEQLEGNARDLVPERRVGRRRKPRFVSTLRAIDRIIGGSDNALGGTDAIPSLSQTEAMELYATANRLRKMAEELTRMLQHRATTRAKAGLQEP